MTWQHSWYNWLNMVDLPKLWGKIPILNPKGLVTVHPPSTPANLENLFDALHPSVTPKWQQLGEVLGVKENLIDMIFTNNEMDEECLKEILEVWIKKSSPAWKDVADALRKTGETQLAESLYLKCKKFHMTVYKTNL